LKNYITLITYVGPTALSSSPCTNYEFTKLRNCWTFGTSSTECSW